MKTKRRSYLILFLAVVFGALGFLVQARAYEPTYLTFMNQEDGYKSISLAVDGEDLEMDLEATDGAAFGTAKSTVEVSTVNPTGYTLFVAAIGQDHDGSSTNALIHANERVAKTIPSIENDASVVRTGAGDEEIWNTMDFPSNRWGVGTTLNGRDYTFSSISTEPKVLKTTETQQEQDLTGAVVGVKVDGDTPSGEYKNTLEFTALANPVSFTYSVKYDANGGTNAPANYSMVVFDELSHVVTVSDGVPTRAKHNTGDWIFLGWSEDPNATTATYRPGDEITLTAPEDGSLTAEVKLYAVWQESYNYALNFASGTSATVTNLPGKMSATSTGDGVFIIPSVTPSRSGNVFTGYTDGSKDYQPGETYRIPSSTSGSDPITKTLTAKWRQTCTSNCDEIDVDTGGVVDYGYIGGVKAVTIRQAGTYKLEVWGAQGIDYGSYSGGYGGYSTGEITLPANTVLYIAVGGQGVSFNGGVATYSSAHYGSGGATHIATRSGQLSSLSGYISDILIVAGGGGGACTTGGGGYGGGANQYGGTGAGGYSNRLPGTGGTLSSGGYAQAGYSNSNGSFGQGGTNTAGGSSGGSMGGGGYYGGGPGGSDWSNYNDNDDGSGGGGSGYANTSRMTKISGTSGARTGHGYARITCMRSS